MINIVVPIIAILSLIMILLYIKVLVDEENELKELVKKRDEKSCRIGP